MSQAPGEWFRGSSNGVWAIVALVAVVAVIVGDAVSGWHLAVTLGAVLFGLLAYATFVRPRVGVERGELVLHHLYSTQRLPVAAVESVAIGRTFEATAAGRHYVSSAIMRPLRQAISLQGPATPETSYPDFVEARIRSLADDARATAGIARESEEQWALAEDVRRTWDWPLIGVTVVVAVAFVVAIVV